MDPINNTLTVRISGKNTSGESFQELATLEQFGNFGVLIHTTQQLGLSEKIYICGGNGEPIASAEVVWVRSGDFPAVEALLYRASEPSEAAAPDTSLPVTETKPAAQSVSMANGRTANLGKGSYGAGTGKLADESTERDVSISSGTRSDRSISSPGTKRLSRERREEAEPKQTKQLKQVPAKARAQIATLQQHRKIALAALAVLTIFFIVAFAPAFMPAGDTDSVPIEILEQGGCLDVVTIKGQTSEEVGDLECWTQANNGAVQFIRREDITIGQLSTELGNLRKDGLTPRGHWCPKGEGRMVEYPDSSQLPSMVRSLWTLKPIGANAATLGELTLQLKNGQLLFQETTKQSMLNRTQEVAKVVYYSGLQKFVVKLNDDSSTSASSPIVKELILYLPSDKETTAIAEGQLTNSTWQIYQAQLSSQPAGFNLNIREIISLVLGLAVMATLAYIIIISLRSRKLAAN
jgi:hypothetical protein